MLSRAQGRAAAWPQPTLWGRLRPYASASHFRLHPGPEHGPSPLPSLHLRPGPPLRPAQRPAERRLQLRHLLRLSPAPNPIRLDGLHPKRRPDLYAGPGHLLGRAQPAHVEQRRHLSGRHLHPGRGHARRRLSGQHCLGRTQRTGHLWPPAWTRPHRRRRSQRPYRHLGADALGAGASPQLSARPGPEHRRARPRRRRQDDGLLPHRPQPQHR